MSLTKGKLILVACLTFFLSMTTAYAQTGIDEGAQLREEFRAALLSDPRATALSESELAAMVDALAGEAEAQSVVSDFVLPLLPPLPEFVQEYTDTLTTPWGQPVTPLTLYGVILICLACAGLLLWWLLHLHRLAAISR